LRRLTSRHRPAPASSRWPAGSAASNKPIRTAENASIAIDGGFAFCTTSPGTPIMSTGNGPHQISAASVTSPPPASA